MRFAYPIAVPDSEVQIMAWCDEYETAFRKIKEMGYEGVELLVHDPRTVDRKRLEQILDETDLVIAAIGTTPMQSKDQLFLMHDDVTVRNEAICRLFELIDLAAYFETDILVGKYRGMVGAGIYTSLTYLQKILKGACEKAAPSGVNIFLEPQNKNNINNLNTMTETLLWIDECKLDNLNILADIFHLSCTEEDTITAFNDIGNRLGMLHMTDSNRQIPGTGTFPVAKILKALKQMNFNGFISLEIKQEPNSEVAARKSIEFLKSIDNREVTG